MWRSWWRVISNCDRTMRILTSSITFFSIFCYNLHFHPYYSVIYIYLRILLSHICFIHIFFYLLIYYYLYFVFNFFCIINFEFIFLLNLWVRIEGSILEELFKKLMLVTYIKLKKINATNFFVKSKTSCLASKRSWFLVLTTQILVLNSINHDDLYRPSLKTVTDWYILIKSFPFFEMLSIIIYIYDVMYIINIHVLFL